MVSILFFYLFFLLISFLFYSIFDLGLGFQCNIMVITITQTYDTEKVIEDSGTNNVIQHGNNMLAL